MAHDSLGSAAKVQAIADVCEALKRGDDHSAKELVRTTYPFAPVSPVPHGLSAAIATRVFVRDGFIDRYSGDQLLFPPVLRVISTLMPEEFPFHPNWKTTLTHAAYWELGATVDHLVPRSRGGSGADENLITTCMMRNFAKGNFTLEELGWDLRPCGALETWDGLLSWFVSIARERPAILKTPTIRRWHSAAVQAHAARNFST